MAVLKDLIVHGPSRFINTAQFEALKANRIGAEEGVFNKLIATNADIGTLDVDDLTAQNATVVGLLDVQGEMHTNSWTNANIANIGGSFYIAPTIIPTDGTTTISITKNSATSWTVVLTGTFATDFIKTGTNTTGQNWPANSLVLVTGNITVKNMKYPLGTLKGTLSAAVTASAASTSKTVTITGVTDGQGHTTPAVLDELWTLNGANISNAAFSDGKISLYKMGSYPIGIQMSSMGTNANSMIEIYGGVAANPTVRIGHLAGLPTINGTSPTGWGIYTDNGYFSGVIVSNSGKIGNFTIANDLHSGTTGIGKDTNVYVSPGTSSSIAIANSPVNLNWAFTAGNKFGVTTAGDLYAAGAHIEGAITATSLTISSGGTTYSGVSAINANGYSIQIIEDKSAAYSGATMGDNNTYLYPILFLNGVKVESGIVYTNFIWYLDGATTGGIQGHSSNGGVVAEYGHTYRVTYSVDDTAVGEAQPSTYINVDPSKYITRIADNGITVHPETMAANSNYIHIDGNSLMVKRQVGTTAAVSTDTILASFGTTAQIGQNGSSRFLMNSDSLQAYNSSGIKYFEVTPNGLIWGSNNTAATTTQVDTAAQTATNFIKTDESGIKVQNSTDATNYVHIGSDGIQIYESDNSVASFKATTRIGQDSKTHIYIDSTSNDAGIKFITQYKTVNNVVTNFSLGDIGFNANAGWTNTPTDDNGYFPKGAWFTFGYRTFNTFKGYYSFITGYKCAATHNGSAAGGIMCSAYGPMSLAFGNNCITGYASNSSVSEGTAGDNGWAAIALGSNLIARHDVECVVGAYNATSSTSYPFIVGNGNASVRRNAFTVDWSGNIRYSGSAASTSDRRLKDHQSYLSIDAVKFIRNLKPAHFIKDNAHHVGFYAQDVEEVDPWNCMTGEMNGFKTLGYTEIIAPLVAYCQHLEERIQQLEGK